MIPQPRLGDSVCGQSLRQQSLLITFFKRLHCRTRKPFRLADATLGQESAGSRVVNLGRGFNVFEFYEQLTSAIQMAVCFLVSTNREKQIANIIFDSCE